MRAKPTPSGGPALPSAAAPRAKTPKTGQLTDLSPMPFGQYQGKPMQDIPASYLHWLWSKPGGLRGNVHNEVGQYIRDNLEALKKDHPDGIWS